jgi:hypothetical protein
MNATNIDIHKPLFRTLQEINTSKQHTHPTSYIKTETATRNIQNSYAAPKETNTPAKCK